MALFGFGKKKEEKAPAPPPSGIPVDQVLTMKGQGYADNQIVENLQSQGYNSSQIFDAMNQAGMSQQTPPAEPMAEQQPPYPPAEPYPSEQPPPPVEDYATPVTPVTEKERIEELAEAIIDEKWEELVKDINKVIEWKEKTESRINKIEQALEDLKLGVESLHKSLIARISDYDKSLANVGVEIKAMEKVFQKILPSLTESINRLDRLGKKAVSKK
jgi:hypothetical protein